MAKIVPPPSTRSASLSPARYSKKARIQMRWLSSHTGFQLISLFCLCCVAPCWADGPADNDAATVRPVPPPGIEVTETQRIKILDRAAAIEMAINQLTGVDEISRDLVAVFPRAARITLETGMVYSEKELEQIHQLLDQAEGRLKAIQAGSRRLDVFQIPHAADNRPHLTVGGYTSRIDGSIQPYGLVLPAGWTPSDKKLRLDVWLHGRGEKVSEAAFLAQRQTQVGEYSPENTVVLHPYGRYCNAFKFAGEIDILEAMEQVKQLLPIDDSRVTIRGFSMGGAGCWQMAVHYPNIWAAANPGAGFSETTEFLRVFQSEDFKPTWYQQRLLHWYDCPDWTNNLRNVPTIAYSGEIDKQKQAADIMEAAFALRGMKLPHIIGPQTAHKLHPDSKVEIQTGLDRILADGKAEIPESVDLTTYSLRYHQLAWLSIEGLKEHWQEARVQGRLENNLVKLTSQNVRRLRLAVPPSKHFTQNKSAQIVIDQQALVARAQPDSSLTVSLEQDSEGHWQIAREPVSGLSKRPGLQGPIDDAFLDAFTFVAPNQVANPSAVDRWIEQEYAHAKSEWRRHFRGEIVEVACDELDEATVRDRNLILFGTPRSNSTIAKIAEQLPIRWSAASIEVGNESWPTATHVALMIYPNPLNPNRYVVLNSGFTYREYAYLNNARQVSMLPDWAISDISQGSTTQDPGAVKAAGFFDEKWKLSSVAR